MGTDSVALRYLREFNSHFSKSHWAPKLGCRSLKLRRQLRADDGVPEAFPIKLSDFTGE